MTMDIVFQGALIVASSALAVFCLILARRLRKLNDLETGLGGAIAVMAAEVDRLERSVIAARAEATEASEALGREIARAQKERAAWELHKKLTGAAQSPAPRRLRKRSEVAHA